MNRCWNCSKNDDEVVVVHRLHVELTRKIGMGVAMMTDVREIVMKAESLRTYCCGLSITSSRIAVVSAIQRVEIDQNHKCIEIEHLSAVVSA